MDRWQIDADRVWSLRDEVGDPVAVITQLGPYLGQPEPVFAASGPITSEVARYPTFEAAQQAVEELRRR